MIVHQVHTHWVRLVLALVVLVCFSVSTHAAELDEYSVFIGGFTAFQNQDYQGAATKMSQFLKEYPATPLRDMALFWLARAHFRLGEKQEAARYMAQFLKENPDTPLRTAAEPELIALAQGFAEKGDAGGAALDKKPVVAAAEQKALVAAAPVARAVTGQQPASGKPQATAPVVTPKSTVPERVEPILTMKERAVREYRSVQEKFPGTQAASIAAKRLEELQRGSGDPDGKPEPIAAAKAGDQKSAVVTFEVVQYAAVELTVRPVAERSAAGATISIPFEVVNRGNGADSFGLEDGFPAEYQARIVSAAHPESALASTPQLSPGESFAGMVILTVPAAIIDGQRGTFPIRLVSKFDSDISLSKEVSLVFSAPLLRMAIRPDKQIVLPGETISYKIALLNVGSAVARKISFTFSYPAHYEPVEPLPAGFRRDGTSRLSGEEMDVSSGGRKEFNLAFRLKHDAIAGQELFCRTELHNNVLKLSEAFLSSAAVVGKIHGVTVRIQSGKRTVLPGERLVFPVSVINTGNFRENFSLKTSIPASIRHTIYRTGGSGDKQTDELIVDSIGSLSPKEEATLKIELFVPASSIDKVEESFTITVEPESARNKSAGATVYLVHSRPVVTLEMSASNGRLKPSEVAHLVLNVVNNGSGMAKDVEVISHLPERIDLVASEPVAVGGRTGDHAWRFTELGPGEKRSIVLAYRVRPGVAAGTNMQIENRLSYKDQRGNSY
ncbi:MAG: tetratricopeptide repeat protein [Deltaproteobacteria bacterium]|nr:tetratricopeptide repeat protein [Deltaproteobacteria bacterium]TLN03210.1 MAG: tetratricopeptide repeat protein [bacterium]